MSAPGLHKAADRYILILRNANQAPTEKLFEFPGRAIRLFAASEDNAKERYEHLMKLKELYE